MNIIIVLLLIILHLVLLILLWIFMNLDKNRVESPLSIYLSNMIKKGIHISNKKYFKNLSTI